MPRLTVCAESSLDDTQCAWINELDAQNLIPKISEVNRTKLKSGITKEKIEKTLKTLGKNKIRQEQAERTTENG